MNIYRRKELARTADETMEAVGYRLRAARGAVNVDKYEIASFNYGMVSLEHLEAAEAGRVFPKSQLLNFYRLKFGLPDTFFFAGEVSRIDAGIEDRLFAALKAESAK